jgi:hypothetical protein
MEILGVLILGLAVPAMVMAAAASRGKSSLSSFAFRFVLCFAGIVVPIAIFLLSAFMIPLWKGEAHHGWVDCFPTGKLALAPLVFWAAWALYHFQIVEAPGPVTKSIGQGLFIGALVSCVCFVQGFVFVTGFASTRGGGGLMLWLIVPLYVAAWYSWASVSSIFISGLKFMDYVLAICISIPFWIGSVLLSQCCYQSLSNIPPTCFVVTAASRGHRRFVGPFFPIARRGESRLANKQLQTFWRFEELWQKSAPRTHRAFRKVYNRIGPIVAGRIRSPLVADMVYMALKPFEMAGRLLIGIAAQGLPKVSNSIKD